MHYINENEPNGTRICVVMRRRYMCVLADEYMVENEKDGLIDARRTEDTPHQSSTQEEKKELFHSHTATGKQTKDTITSTTTSIEHHREQRGNKLKARHTGQEEEKIQVSFNETTTTTTPLETETANYGHYHRG